MCVSMYRSRNEPYLSNVNMCSQPRSDNVNVIVMHGQRCAVPDEVGQLLVKAMGLDEYKEEDEEL